MNRHPSDQEKFNNSSYAVVPCFILDDQSLNEGAKILYARICMYSQEGRCWATNAHFAEKQQVDISTIKRWLEQLKKSGYIEVEIETGSFQTQRNIWLVNDFKKNYTKAHSRAGGGSSMSRGGGTNEPPISINKISSEKTTTTHTPKEQVVVVSSEEENSQVHACVQYTASPVLDWGDSWRIPGELFRQLIRKHGFEYVASQIGYMVRQHKQALHDQTTTKKKRANMVDRPEGFLVDACSKNYAKKLENKS